MLNEIAALTLQDLIKPEILADPYPLFRRLRDEVPVHQDPGGQAWMVSRYADAVSVLSNPVFSANLITPRGDKESRFDSVPAMLRRQLILIDPPDHTRLRGLFARAMTPARVETLRLHALATATRLLDAADKTGTIDFIAEFAIIVPITVIARLIGIPESDLNLLRAWSMSFGKLLGGSAITAGEYLECRDSVLDFIEYCEALIKARRQAPKDDLLSDLVRIEAEGDRISIDELVSNLILLVVAGHGTVTHLIGNGLIALHRHPEQWRLLGGDPAIVPGAVTELLRYDGPVQTAVRDATADVEVGGRLIAKGQRVVVILGSANRDERHFDEPDRLDLRRTGTRLLSFGYGIHACIGAMLGRMEAQVAFGEISRRFPDFRVETDRPDWSPEVNFRGVSSLPVRLGDTRGS